MALNSYPVVWTEAAIENLDTISSYLLKHWSEKEVQQFFIRLDKRIILISQFPRLFRISKSHKTIRRSVLDKQTSIYYRFANGYVEILYIFDNRQDPDKLNLEE